MVAGQTLSTRLQGGALPIDDVVRLPAEQAPLAGAKTVDPEVYDLRLKGAYHLERMTKVDFDTAERYFQRALAKDPTSARVYAGISAVWGYRRQLGMVSAREAGLKQKAALRKAIELDDRLPGSRAALAAERRLTDLNPLEAEREFRRAIEFDPNDADARASYSHVLMNLGRSGEAMQQIERAVAIDPLSSTVRTFYAMDLVFARRYDEALAQANDVLHSTNRASLGLECGHLLHST